GESASDSFTYTMQDGAGAQSTATVNLTINGISDAPTAVADSFDAIGNTGLFVGTTRPATQAGKEISGSVLSNDTDPDTPQASLVAEPVTNAPTTLGGTITIESDGNFTYQPDDVDTGVTDTFTYRVCDASPCNSGTVANATGTLSLPIAGQVWYVRNNEAAGGDGTSDTPFDTLLEAETASGANDTVFVFDGDNTATNLGTGYVMNSGERLIGESQPLSLDPDGGGPLALSTLHPGTAGAQPTLTASNEDVVVLASDAVVDGFDLDPAGAGGGISGGVGTNNVTVGHVNVVDTGTAGTQPGIELDATTGTNRFSNTTVQNGGSATAIGVRVNNAGTVQFAQAGTNTITTTGAKALDVASTSMGTSEWDDITVTGSGTGAIRLSSATGTTRLGDGSGTDLALQTTSGATPALDIASSTTTTVDAGGSDTVDATGGPALDIRNTNASTFNFDSVSSSNSAGDGLNLDTNLTSPVTATGGAISGAAGIAVDVNGGGTGGGDVVYPGAINNGAGQTAEITGRDGGSVTLNGNIADSNDAGGGIVVSANSGGAMTFGGASKVLSTGASTAVSHTSNAPGTALSLQGGGLDIDTTSGAGIDSASNGGTIDVQGSGNTIDTTTGRALNVSTSPIGAAGLTFQRISANGAVNGIVLNSTGVAGGLTVTGTGAAGSGGTIQNTTSDSLALTTTRNVSLTSMNVSNSLESGILGTGVTNLTLAGSNFTGNGDDSGDVGIKVNNLLGANPWSDLSVTGSELANVFVDNTSGTLSSLNITGASHFDSLGTAFGGNSILIEMRGTAVMTSGMVDGATFVDNKPARGITVQSQDAGRIGDAGSNAFTLQNSTFTNNGLQASFEQSGTADLTFKMLNNGTPAVPLTMPNTAGGTSHAVNIASSSTSTSGTIRGRVSGNRIGNSAVAGSGSAIGNAIRALIQGKTSGSLLIDGNVIRQVPQARGIDVQALGPLNASGAGPIDVTVTNNDVNPQDSTGFPLSAIYVAADSQGGGPVTLRADIRGNTVPAGVASDGLPTFLALDKVVAAAVCQLVDTPPASANATAQLTSTNTGSASAAAGCALIAGPITTPP
ncbi:MAG: Ig-like domain-containing protein, partial [Mycobacteriales bacterium]